MAKQYTFGNKNKQDISVYFQHGFEALVTGKCDAWLASYPNYKTIESVDGKKRNISTDLEFYTTESFNKLILKGAESAIYEILKDKAVSCVIYQVDCDLAISSYQDGGVGVHQNIQGSYVSPYID